MPVYNGASYIKKTIPYILSNSHDFELLLVNDGSKDDSLNICKEFAKGDRRIKVINKQNGGIADARNFGLSKASGEYLAFVDQDDYIELDTIMGILSDHNEDIILFSTVKDYGTFRESCDTVKEQKLFETKEEVYRHCIWPMIYPTVNTGEVSHFAHVWQGVYKNSTINNASINFKRFVSIEDDFLFLLEAFLAAETVSLVPDVGYRWVTNLQSTTYRRNYVENMKDKCESYYTYTNNILKKSKYFTDYYCIQYNKMAKQVLGVRLVINEGNNNSFFASIKIIKKYIKDNSEYFTGKYLGEGASRKSAKYIYKLLKLRLVFLALLFQYIIVFYKSRQGDENK